MKRQLFESKSGFTLFELMLVITIFGAFIFSSNIFNYSPQTESEKADRMMTAMSSRIKSELQNIALGRMPKNNGVIAGNIRILIGTGGMTTSYYTGSNTSVLISSGAFRNPFYDADRKYEIKSVIWTGSSTVPVGYSGTGELIIEPNGMSFSGIGITGSGFSLLEIKVGYNSRSRKVILDRRTGKIIETKLY